MPLLVSIDEYDSAITAIAAHAQVALASSDPDHRQAALRLIMSVCKQVDETVSDVLSHVGPDTLGLLEIFVEETDKQLI